MQPSREPHRPSGATGELVVVAKTGGLLLNWPVRVLTRPEIGIGDTTTRGRWGTNTFELAEGQHSVYVIVRWPMLHYGGAHAGVTIVGGQQAVLYYKAPVTRMDPGTLDRDPHHHPGRSEAVRFSIVLLVALVGVAVLAFLYYG